MPEDAAFPDEALPVSGRIRVKMKILSAFSEGFYGKLMRER